MTLYRNLLTDTFGNENTQATLSVLDRKSDYIEWRDNNHSSILRLSGFTKTSPTGLCWLSNFVPGLVDRLRLEDQPTFFYLMHCRHWMEDDMPMNDIVSSVIMQLLQVRSKDLRDWKRFDAIHRMLQSDLWSKDLNSVCKTLVIVLEEF